VRRLSFPKLMLTTEESSLVSSTWAGNLMSRFLKATFVFMNRLSSSDVLVPSTSAQLGRSMTRFWKKCGWKKGGEVSYSILSLFKVRGRWIVSAYTRLSKITSRASFG